jgi:glucosamine--fructose-6-phosphate aminotransferase (isomerizing)
MCGIIGYIGKRQAAPILLDGLRNLDYRGYDSCGIAVIGQDLIIKKDVGRIEDVNKKLNFLSTQGNIGIGHTRWSTHGGVTRENSHPHLSNNGKIAVVHNGIIENFQEQKNS